MSIEYKALILPNKIANSRSEVEWWRNKVEMESLILQNISELQKIYGGREKENRGFFFFLFF